MIWFVFVVVIVITIIIWLALCDINVYRESRVCRVRGQIGHGMRSRVRGGITGCAVLQLDGFEFNGNSLNCDFQNDQRSRDPLLSIM